MAKNMKIRQLIPQVLAIVLFGLAGCSGSSHFRVDQLFCNNRINPVGVEGTPEFRWTVVSDKNGTDVTGYEIRLGDQKIDRLDDVKTLTLEAGKRYEWQVRVRDEKGKFSAWSKKAWFVTGFPDSGWSGAEWIGFEELPDSLKLVPGVHGSGDELGNLALRKPVVPVFRKTLSIGKTVSEAWIFVSGLGQYTIEMDGKDLTGGFMRPGWTNYAKTCFYNGYDLTEQLKNGPHDILVTVGNGFFNINRERYRKMVSAWGMP
jgi:hypothetical protein